MSDEPNEHERAVIAAAKEWYEAKRSFFDFAPVYSHMVSPLYEKEHGAEAASRASEEARQRMKAIEEQEEQSRWRLYQTLRAA